MRLDAIHLHNWQPYIGRGVKAKKIGLKGKSGQKNLIIYGQNTNGKTAIWQAIQFGFYGRVNKRKTGWEEGKFKPPIGDNTAQEPLLNQTANENGDFTFGVTLEFNHEGDDFTLERTCYPRSGVKLPRKVREMEVPKLTIRNNTEGKFITGDPQDFINDILPEKLAQFFIFDGERLDEYRLLFEDTNDVKLKGYIEAILRFPVLTHGIQDFTDMKKKAEKENRKFLRRQSKDKDLNDDIKELEAMEDEITTLIGKRDTEINGLKDNLSEIDEWLRQNDKGKEALEQQKLYTEQKEEYEKQIVKIQKRLSKALPDSWRSIVSSRIEERLGRLDSDIVRQREETERIAEIKGEIVDLNDEMEGKPCNKCGHVRDKPSADEKDEILRKILEFEREKDNLEVSRLDPDPHYLLTKQRALLAISSNTKLDNLIQMERDLLDYKGKIRETENLLEAAMKLISTEARREVQEYLLKQKNITESIGGLESDQRADKGSLETVEKEITKLTDKLHGGSTIAHNKTEKNIEVLSELISVWENVTDSHRENMRGRVESHATDVFMSLTNKKRSYGGLKISKDFQIDIVNKKGKPVAGSSGQSALMAYSVLDALTRSSDIEFPLVVDTPARSIDDENLERLFDYLLLESGKQVLVFPEGKELKPDDGDARYGSHCSATYEISLDPSNEDLSLITIREDNLE